MPEVEQGSSVWVTMADGTRFEMKEPKVVDSKLVGYVEPEGRREVDLAEIVSLAVREQDKTKTIALAAWCTLAAMVLISILGDGEKSKPCPT